VCRSGRRRFQFSAASQVGVKILEKPGQERAAGREVWQVGGGKRDDADKPAAVVAGDVDVHGGGVPAVRRDRRCGVERALDWLTDAPRKPQGHLLSLVLVLLGEGLIREADLVEHLPDVRPRKHDFDPVEHLAQGRRVRAALGKHVRQFQRRAELFGHSATLLQRPCAEATGAQRAEAFPRLGAETAEVAQEPQGGLRLVKCLFGRDRLTLVRLARAGGVRAIREEACRPDDQTKVP